MIPAPVRRVLVVGPPGSGKSTLAAQFGNLNNPRIVGVDLESTCMQSCDAQTLTPLQEENPKGLQIALFDISKLETQLEGIAPDVVVIACGDLNNSFLMTHLFDAIVFLDVKPETVRQRLSTRPKDSWAAKQDLVESLVLTIGTRRLFWQHFGATVINNDGSISETVQTILEMVDLEAS